MKSLFLFLWIPITLNSWLFRTKIGEQEEPLWVETKCSILSFWIDWISPWLKDNSLPSGNWTI